MAVTDGCRSCQVSEQNRLVGWWLASVAAAEDGTGRIFKILTGGGMAELEQLIRVGEYRETVIRN
jgi:hypothetical protein